MSFTFWWKWISSLSLLEVSFTGNLFWLDNSNNFIRYSSSAFSCYKKKAEITQITQMYLQVFPYIWWNNNLTVANCLGEISVLGFLKHSPHTLLFARHESQLLPRNSLGSKQVKLICRGIADCIVKTQRLFRGRRNSVWHTSVSDQLNCKSMKLILFLYFHHPNACVSL